MTSRSVYLCLIITLPLAALLLASSDRPVDPFGWYELLFAQQLAAIPLALVLAQRCLGWVRGGPLDTSLLWISLGLALAVLTVVTGNSLATVFLDARSDFTTRFLIRFSWCLALAFPWSLAWLLSRPGVPVTRLSTLALAGTAALVLPWLYAQQRIQTDLRDPGVAQGTKPAVRLLPIVDRLITVGATGKIADMPLGKYREALVERIKVAQSILQQPGRDVVDRATALRTLDRLSEAETLLSAEQSLSVSGRLLLAELYQEQQRYPESDALYRIIQEEIFPVFRMDPDRIPTAAAMMVGPAPVLRASPRAIRAQAFRYGQTANGHAIRIYDMLANNARATNRWADVETIYSEAIEQMPWAAPYFHFQLGKQLKDLGRPAKAIEHLQQAAKLYPEEYGEVVKKPLRELQERTPGCLLRSTSAK